MSLFVTFGFSLASPLAGVVFSGLPVVFAVALFVLAAADRDQLRGRGCLSAASPFWILLSPIGYLAVRWLTVRQYGGSGSSPLIALAAQLVSLSAIFMVWSGLLGFGDMSN